MEIRTVGVVGAGVMGAGVAQNLAETGHDVVLIDVAEAALFLCSDRARTITGQSLFVNAGNHMS